LRRIVLGLLLMMVLLCSCGAVDRRWFIINDSPPTPFAPLDSLTFPAYHNLVYDQTSTHLDYPGGYDQWIQDMATNDVIVLQQIFLDDGAREIPTLVSNTVKDVRAINGTVPILFYLNIVQLHESWDPAEKNGESKADFYWHSRLWQALDQEAYEGGKDGWLRDTNGDLVQVNAQFSARMFRFSPMVADTISYYYLKMFETTRNKSSWIGIYFDYFNNNLENWMCESGSCQSNADIDQDGVAYASDPDESDMFAAFNDSLLAKLERGMPEAIGSQKFLFIGNGSAAMNFTSRNYHDYLDGAFVERFDQDWCTASSWELAANTSHENLGKRIESPIIMIESTSGDVGATEYVEAVALACLATGNVWSSNMSSLEAAIGEWGTGRGVAPALNDLPAAGASLGDATVSGDTLSRAFENMTVWAIVDTDGTPNYSDTAPLPYLIVSSEGDTLRRGGGWPREDLPVGEDICIASNDLYESEDFSAGAEWDSGEGAFVGWNSTTGFEWPREVAGPLPELSTAQVCSLTSSTPGWHSMFNGPKLQNDYKLVNCSVYLKNTDNPITSNIQFRWYNSSYDTSVFYDWSGNELVLVSQDEASDAGVEDVGNGWYRAWFTVDRSVFGDTDADYDLRFSPRYGSGDQAGETIYITGAQVNFGCDEPQDYVHKSGGEVIEYVPAAVDTTPPAVPTGLQAQPWDQLVVLSWDNDDDPDYWTLYWGLDDDAMTNEVPITGGSPAYLHTGLTNGVEYYYAVTASDSLDNESEQCDWVSTVPFADDPPGDPLEGAIMLSQSDFASGWCVLDLPNETYALSTDITVPRHGIVFAHTADGSTLNLNGKTLTFCNTSDRAAIAIYTAPNYYNANPQPWHTAWRDADDAPDPSVCGGNGVHDITITNGTIIQGAGAGLSIDVTDAGTDQERTHYNGVHGIQASGSMTLTDLTIIVNGSEAECVDLSGPEYLTVTNCVFTNNSIWVENRHQGRAALDVSMSTKDYARVDVTNTVFNVTQQWGFRIAEHGSYPATDSTIVRGCTFNCDNRVTNGYQVGAHRGLIDISWNTFNVTNGRGIHLASGDGYRVYENDITATECQNFEYDYLYAHGISIEEATGIEIYDNTVLATAERVYDEDDYDPDEDYLDFQGYALNLYVTDSNANISIHDNVFDGRNYGGTGFTLPSTSDYFNNKAVACYIRTTCETPGIEIYDNLFRSNHMLVACSWDVGDQGGVDVNFVGNEWEYYEATGVTGTVDFCPMYFRNSDGNSFDELIFSDNTYTNWDGFDADTEMARSGGNGYEWGVGHSCTVTVERSGVAVEGATVVATSATCTNIQDSDYTIVEGVTDANGEVVIYLPEFLDTRSGTTTCSDYTITASEGGDSDSETFTATASGSLTIEISGS
jgi:hypothetical protein